MRNWGLAPVRFFWAIGAFALFWEIGSRAASWSGWDSAGGLAGMDAPLQCLAIGIALTAAARDEWGHWEMSAATLIALALTIGDPMARWAHPFLLEMSLYPPFFGRGNDPQQSPQYARLLLWAIALLSLAGAIAAKKGKCLGKWFALLASGSVLATGALFHASAMIQVRYAEKIAFEEARGKLASASVAAFDEWCSSGGYLCKRAAGISEFPEELEFGFGKSQARKTWRDVGSSGNGSAAVWKETASSEDFNRLPTALLGVGKDQDGNMRLWADMKRQRERLQVSEATFALQALPAHSLWIYGGFWAALAHARRARKRKAAAL